MKTSFLANCLPGLEKGLLLEMEKHSSVQQFSAQECVVKQGQYIRHLPIVLKGSIKVYSVEETTQFLLYYISAGGACIFSFAHTLNAQPAEFSAAAEIDAELLLLPVDQVNEWLNSYPSFGCLLLTAYQKHYEELLHTTKQVICYNLENRLTDYLRTKSEMEKSDLLSLSHQQVADDLGTSREVVSRLMKKLGSNNTIEQVGRRIKVL